MIHQLDKSFSLLNILQMLFPDQGKTGLYLVQFLSVPYESYDIPLNVHPNNISPEFDVESDLLQENAVRHYVSESHSIN